jgi:ABC-type nitrate/sulfonate/bicarbonate transport system ATPase subunit
MVMSNRPGVIKKTYDIAFPRPRGKSTKLLPEFHQLMADLREDLQ